MSQHFSIGELCVSDTAVKHGIANTPTPEHLHNIETYLMPGLEHVRTILDDRTIRIFSGYRNPKVNKLVKGTPTSAHPQGLAADLRAAGISAEQAAFAIARAMKRKEIEIDQLILESSRGVVHVSFDPRTGHGGPRMQMGHQPGAAFTAIDWNYFARA